MMEGGSTASGSLASASMVSMATDTSSGFMPTCRWNLLQFGFMCAYTMGYTAIWKFPFLVYKHTGLFLVAYYSLLVLVCIPVTFLQLKLGAVLRRGIVGIFSHFCPALKGVAVAILLVAFFQVVYHSVYLAYSLYYMFMAFPQPYVWSHAANASRLTHSHVYYQHAQNPAEHYYYNVFLQVTESMAQPGTMPWYLGACLVATWAITYLFVFRGPAWFGKVVYCSSPMTIGLLFGLLIYSHTSVSAAPNSLRYFFTQDQSLGDTHVNGEPKDDSSILNSQLASPLTWIRALEQHIYSLGLWSGILPTLGCNLGNKKPASNLTWLIVLLVHSMLPHLGTIAIAPFIHALALLKQRNFDNVINSGPYLLFVVLPEAFNVCDISPIWVCVMYLCFFLFVMHQQALMLVVIAENIAECVPHYSRIVFRRREALLACLCCTGCLLGLPHMLQGGSYLTELMELYLYRIMFVLITFSIIPYVVAYARMNAFHLPIERVCMCIWFALSSFATAGLLVYNLIIFLQPYTNLLEISTWSHLAGWVIAIGPFLLCLIWGFLHALCKADGETGGQRFLATIKPASAAIPIQNPDEMDPDAMLECQEGGGTLRLRKKAKKKVPIGGVPMAGSMELGDDVELLAGRPQQDDERQSDSGLETPGTPKTSLMNPQNRQLLNELHLTFVKKAKDSPQNERRQPDIIPGEDQGSLDSTGEPYFPKPSHIKKRSSMQETSENQGEEKPKPKIVKRKPQTHLDSDEEPEKPRPPIMVPKRKSSSSSDHAPNRKISSSSDPRLSPQDDEVYEDVGIHALGNPPPKPVRMAPVNTAYQGGYDPNAPISPTYQQAQQRTPTTPKSPLQGFQGRSPTGSQGSLGSPGERPQVPLKPKYTSDNGRRKVESPDNVYENVPKLPAKTSKRRSVPPPPPPPPPPVEEYMEPVCTQSSPDESTSQDTVSQNSQIPYTAAAPDLIHDVVEKNVDGLDLLTSADEHQQQQDLYEDVGLPDPSDLQLEDESLELNDEHDDEDVSLSDMIHGEEEENEDYNLEQCAGNALNGLSGPPGYEHQPDSGAYTDDSMDCLSTTADGGQSGDELQDDNDLDQSVADSIEFPPGYDHADFTLTQLNDEDQADINGAMNGMNGSHYEDDNIYEEVEAPPLPRAIRGPAAVNGHGRRSLEISEPIRHLDDASFRRSYHGEDPKRKLRMEVCIAPPEDTAIAQV